MSATGLKAHRRTLSISQPSSENIPSIDTKAPTPNISSDTLFVPSEKVPPLTPPPTPSKQKARLKFYPRKKDRKKEDIQFSHDYDFSLYNVKHVLFTIIFCIALIVFLASLAGIGPLDDDFHYAPKKQVKPLRTEGISDKLREDTENRQDFLDQKATDHIESDEKENNTESSSFNQPNLDELVQQDEQKEKDKIYEREGESVVEIGDEQNYDEFEKDYEYREDYKEYQEGLEHEKGYYEDYQEEPEDDNHNESYQEPEYQDHNVGYQEEFEYDDHNENYQEDQKPLYDEY